MDDRRQLANSKKKGETRWFPASVAILLAFILWLFLVLSEKTFQTFVSIPVKISGIPESFRLSSPSIVSIEVRTEGSGMQLLLAILNAGSDTLDVPFSEYAQKGFFMPDEEIENFRRFFPEGTTIAINNPDTVFLSHEIRNYKTVPISSNVKIRLAPSYRLMAPATFTPDSVKLIGSPSALIHIHSWSVAEYETEKLAEETILQLPFESHPAIQTEPAFASLRVNPAVFTEKRIKLKIETPNLLPGSELLMENREAELVFLVALSDYDKFDESDFGLIADASMITEKTRRLMPHLYRFPPGVEAKEIIPESIPFTLVKAQ